MEKGFTIPAAAAVAPSLFTDQQQITKIAPDTPVLCINRGRVHLTDTFNGQHTPIPPGYFKTQYGAALHFQRRLIVPGTRNLQVGGYLSYIGILGTVDGQIKADNEEFCRQFTDEELAKFGEKVEAIDRSSVMGAGQDVVQQSVSQVLAGSGAFSGGGRSGTQIDVSEQASPLAAEAAEHVFDPPAESATREAEAEAGVGVASGGGRRRR